MQWRKNRGKSVNELISKLPPELKTELSIDSHMQILKKVYKMHVSMFRIIIYFLLFVISILSLFPLTIS